MSSGIPGEGVHSGSKLGAIFCGEMWRNSVPAGLQWVYEADARSWCVGLAKTRDITTSRNGMKRVIRQCAEGYPFVATGR